MVSANRRNHMCVCGSLCLLPLCRMIIQRGRHVGDLAYRLLSLQKLQLFHMPHRISPASSSPDSYAQLPNDQPKVGVPLPQFAHMSTAEAPAATYHRRRRAYQGCCRSREVPFTLPLMRKLSPKANREETPTLAAAPIIGFLRAGGRRRQRAASAASRSGYAPESPGISTATNSNEAGDEHKKKTKNAHRTHIERTSNGTRTQ